MVFSLSSLELSGEIRRTVLFIIIQHGAPFVINQNLKPCWQELLFCQIIIMRTCKGPPRIINKIRRECFEWTIYSFHVSNILRQVKRIVVFVSPASAWMDKVFLLSLPLVGPLCPHLAALHCKYI